MSLIPFEFTVAKTHVFWDLGHCPIPENCKPASISKNIKSALINKGYVGEVLISAYSEMDQNPKDFESSGITLLPTGDKYERNYKMLDDIMWWAIDENRKPFNLMLISEDISKDRLYLKTVHFWSDRSGNILLVQPGNFIDDENLSRDGHVSAVWLWETLSIGGNSISLPSHRSSQEVANKWRSSSTSTSKPQSKGKKKIWIPKVKTSNPVSESSSTH